MGQNDEYSPQKASDVDKWKGNLVFGTCTRLNA